MSDQVNHAFVDVSGAIDEKVTPSNVQRSKLLSINLKFSAALTQDTLYINKLDENDNVINQYAWILYQHSTTATNFTWVPPVDGFKLQPKQQIQVVFANNDVRTLSVPESNIEYEFI